MHVPTFDSNGLFTGSRSNLTPEQRDEVIELAEAGVGRNEIARRTGIRQETVSKLTAAAGIGFADRAKTAVAVRARVIQAQLRQLDQIEVGADLTDQAQVILQAVGAAGDGINLNAYAIAARAYRDVTTAKEALLRPFIAIWATDPGTLEGAVDFLDQMDAGIGEAVASGVPGQYGMVRIVSSYAESQAALTPPTQELSPLVSDTSPVSETSEADHDHRE